jgi:mRNA-degrading endonuclease RelE of RelBE toxin-antitoxin system
VKLIEVNFLPTFNRQLKTFKINADKVKDNIVEELQHYVDENPESLYFPDSVAGISNLWKIRVESRGGFRALYYAIPRTRHFDFIMIFPKNIQANLTDKQKKIIRKIIKELEE